MTPELAARIGWAREGAALFERTMAGLSDAELGEPSTLPGWRRGHVAAHLAGNADALVNLLTWARTGVETPMYASREQREADIQRDAGLPAGELRERLATAGARFDRALAELPDDAWNAEVRTVLGRAVPASQVPWLRAREVWVHSVDLAGGAGFADVPPPVLTALIDDAVAGFATRPGLPHVALVATGGEPRWELGSSGGDPVTVSGAPADLAAYLLGRPVTGRLESGAGAGRPPALPGWL
jgi:maleylpyruvate isomerase